MGEPPSIHPQGPSWSSAVPGRQRAGACSPAHIGEQDAQRRAREGRRAPFGSGSSRTGGQRRSTQVGASAATHQAGGLGGVSPKESGQSTACRGEAPNPVVARLREAGSQDWKVPDFIGRRRRGRRVRSVPTSSTSHARPSCSHAAARRHRSGRWSWNRGMDCRSGADRR